MWSPRPGKHHGSRLYRCRKPRLFRPGEIFDEEIAYGEVENENSVELIAGMRF